MIPAAAASAPGPPYFFAFTMLSAGVILCAGIIAAVVGLARRRDWTYLAYAAVCVSLGAAIALDGFLDLGPSLETAASFLRWDTTLTVVSIAALWQFTALYTRQRSVAPWAIAVGGVTLVLLALNLASPYGLRYATLEALEPLRFPWGETLQPYGGRIDTFGHYFTRAFILGVFGWMLARSVILYRAGARRPAIYLGAFVAAFTLSTLLGLLSDLGVVVMASASNVTNLALVGLLAVSLGLDLKDQSRELVRITRALNSELGARRETQAKLAHRAYHDPITGLANRAQLEERLAAVAGEVHGGDRHAALIVLNLDAFKPVKATYGHDVGDQALRRVGEELVAIAPTGWRVFDLGGDEFAILSPALPGEGRAMQSAGELAATACERLRVPMSIEGRPIRITASAGITAISGAAAQGPAALRAANIAMVDAKGSGGNRAAVFEERMERSARRRADLERELREALESGRLDLHFQPQLDAAGAMIGAEALVRWPHSHGAISPEEFVPIAESTGLVHALGEWVMSRAARMLRELPAGAWPVAVNVSPWELLRPDYPQHVERILREAGVPPSRLVIEVTEGVMVHRFEDVAANMSRLRELGVRMSIDDFGTGYSSLAYLQRLPVDQIKIDRAFVVTLGQQGRHPLAKSIADIGHALGLQVLAEGVETGVQRELLFALGCHGLQGYLLQRPLDAAAFRAYVEGSLVPV